MLSALVLDASALSRLEHAGGFSSQWFETFSQDELPTDVARIELNDIVFLLGPDAINQPRLLVLSLADTGLFRSLREEHRNEALRRIVYIGAHPTQRVAASWAPYHSGSKMSLQCVPYAMRRDPPRLEFELNPAGLRHTYLYALDESKRRLENAPVPLSAFITVLRLFDDAALQRSEWTPTGANASPSEWTLNPIENRVSLGIRRAEWLNGRLTSTQQRFLTTPLKQSLRLFGAAGT